MSNVSHGAKDAPVHSPISPVEFERLKQTAAFGDDDIAALRRSRAILEPQVEAILDVWYGFIGSLPHLLASFGRRGDGAPIPEYLAAVRIRFARWIVDTTRAEYDASWLDQQHEIGLRHHRARKNRTDSAPSTDIVPLRHLFPIIAPVTATLRPFLAAAGDPPEEVDKMALAWLKSILLQVTLWSQPYVRAGDY